MKKKKNKCVECGALFTPHFRRPDQMYCSHQCIARVWARRDREAHPEKKTIAGGRPSRATKPPRKEGECTACGKIFPNTEDFFQLIRMKRKDRDDWVGFSSECRECRKARFRKHYADNREEQIERVSKYIKSHPEKRNAQNMARYAAKIAPQMPAWADQRKIETIYAIADFLTERTGIDHQVDHVYPLKGKTMCGLHTHHNMRVITALANQQKGNRLDPEFDTWSRTGV